MKQFDRTAWEQYRRNPRGNNILYQNYSNPSAEGQYIPMQMQEPMPNQPQSPLQKPPQEMQERWPQDSTYRNRLPPSMQGYNSNQILQELQKSYQANQNLSAQRNSFTNSIPTQMRTIEQNVTTQQQAANQQRNSSIDQALQNYRRAYDALAQRGMSYSHMSNYDIYKAASEVDKYLPPAEAANRLGQSYPYHGLNFYSTNALANNQGQRVDTQGRIVNNNFRRK